MTSGNKERLRLWRQFAAIAAPDVPRIAKDGIPVGETDVVLVCSHDCDVVHDGFADEPVVELLIARSLDAPSVDGNYANGRNPRRFQFRYPEPEGQVFEVRPFEKWTSLREVLGEIEPRPDWELPPQVRRSLSEWLARRYLRTALPDAFNTRLRPAREDIRAALKKGSETISAIYIGVEPETELEPGTDYGIALTAVMKVEDFGVTLLRTRAQETVNKISASISTCPGIRLASDSQLLSEADFTLDDLRNSFRLDTDEDISARAGDHPTAAERS